MIQDIEKIAEIKGKAKIKDSLEVAERLLKNGCVTPKFISDCTDLSISDIQTFDELLRSDHCTKKDIDTLIDNIYKTKSHDIYKVNPYHLMEYVDSILNDETKLPDEEAIVSDIALFIDKDGEYLNSWGITDYANSNPLCLKENIDFVKNE